MQMWLVKEVNQKLQQEITHTDLDAGTPEANVPTIPDCGPYWTGL